MNRQQAAVARLSASRERLRGALIAAPGTEGPPSLLGALVRDHPLAAAALAVLAGGLAMRLRPWRWLLKPGLWVALLPQVVSTLSKAPLGTWAEALMTLLRRAEPAEATAERAAGSAATAAEEAVADTVASQAPMSASAAGLSPAPH